MTYEELMNNETVDMVILRPVVSVDNPGGLTIYRKKDVTKEMLDGYSYFHVPLLSGKTPSTATFVKKIED